jgi:predicted transcriptional regulator of viral defense system
VLSGPISSVLVDDGRIIRLKTGLYLASEAQSVAGMFEAQLALPNCVICLGSALAYYELSTFEPPAIHVAVPRDDRTKAPEYPPTRRFSFGPARYALGAVQTSSEGRLVTIYDREKTICNMISYRRVLGQDLVNESLRNYLSMPGTNKDRLLEYARQLRVEWPVQTHLRIMA